MAGSPRASLASGSEAEGLGCRAPVGERVADSVVLYSPYIVFLFENCSI